MSFAGKNQIPQPHSRPSISVSETPKSWQDIPAPRIKPGDVIAGYGEVKSVREIVPEYAIVVHFINGSTLSYDFHEYVQVYGEVRS